MDDLAEILDEQAERARFSGVLLVDRPSDAPIVRAYGLADRAHQVPCSPETRFAIASGTKGFTALVIVGLVDDGLISLETPARSVLGADLPLVAVDTGAALAPNRGLPRRTRWLPHRIPGG